ncbi:hypothetical protein A9W99_12390 [Mycobacterium sp. 1164966.3]|nr:hypothetical protein A9W99_12390 [Mycobacterium sp. 1164966.3]
MLLVVCEIAEIIVHGDGSLVVLLGPVEDDLDEVVADIYWLAALWAVVVNSNRLPWIEPWLHPPDG